MCSFTLFFLPFGALGSGCSVQQRNAAAYCAGEFFAALQLMMNSWFSVLVVAMDDAILYDGMALALIRCKPDALKPDKCAQDTLILPKDSLVEIEITPL